MLAQSNSKANSKKKKRLDKYIVGALAERISSIVCLMLSIGEETQARGAGYLV